MAEYIDKQAFNNAVREAVRRYPNTFYNGLETARQIAHDLPSADVQPVRHGRWTDKRTIEHDGEWYCSECNKEITIYMGPDRKDRYAYCPNCGARMMDGGNDGK